MYLEAGRCLIGLFAVIVVVLVVVVCMVCMYVCMYGWMYVWMYVCTVVRASMDMSMFRESICPLVVSKGNSQEPLTTRFEKREDPSVTR
jgi:hypothetical protein